MADGSAGHFAGFTLIEVLVALTILAASSSVLLEAFGSALDRAGRLERQRVALLLCRSKIAAVGVESPLVAGRNTGRFENGFGWQVEVGPARNSDGKILRLAAHPIHVTVSWTEGSSVRSVTLESLRLRTIQGDDAS